MLISQSQPKDIPVLNNSLAMGSVSVDNTSREEAKRVLDRVALMSSQVFLHKKISLDDFLYSIRTMPRKTRWVLDYMMAMYLKHPNAYYTQWFVARHCGMSLRHVNRVISMFEDMGLIIKNNKRRQDGSYKWDVLRYEFNFNVRSYSAIKQASLFLPMTRSATLYLVAVNVALSTKNKNVLYSGEELSRDILSYSSEHNHVPGTIHFHEFLLRKEIMTKPIPLTIKNIQNLSLLEQIQLTAFEDDVVSRAVAITNKRRGTIDNVFEYLLKTCKNISLSLNLEPDYKYAQQLAEILKHEEPQKEQLAVNEPVTISNEPVSDALKSFTNITKRAEPKSYKKAYVKNDYTRTNITEDPHEVARKLENNEAYQANLRKLLGIDAKVIPDIFK